MADFLPRGRVLSARGARDEEQDWEGKGTAPEEQEGYYADPNSGAAPQPGGHAAGQVPVAEPSDEEPMDPTGPSFGHGEDGADYGAVEHSAAGPKTPEGAVDAQPGSEGDEGDEGDEGEGEPEADPQSQGDGDQDAEGDRYDSMSYDELKDEVRNSSAEDKPNLNSSADSLREWLRAND